MLGVKRYGHYGRPLLAFPAENGTSDEWERMGMLDAIAPLLEAGRVTVFTVDAGGDGWSDWVLRDVVGHVHHELGGPRPIALAGVSMGAYQAVGLALARADLFDLAIGLSGNYFSLHEDVAAAGEDHVAWLRERLDVLLVVGQGRWEDTTRALDSTRHLAAVMQGRGLRCELDVWGYDVPHDWPSWRAQLAHHLPRFC